MMMMVVKAMSSPGRPRRQRGLKVIKLMTRPHGRRRSQTPPRMMKVPTMVRAYIVFIMAGFQKGIGMLLAVCLLLRIGLIAQFMLNLVTRQFRATVEKHYGEWVVSEKEKAG